MLSVDNMKVDVSEIGYRDVTLSSLGQESVMRQNLVNTAMDHWERLDCLSNS
jgi:hypothetical protein